MSSVGDIKPKRNLIRYEPVLSKLNITTLFVKNLSMSHLRGDRYIQHIHLSTLASQTENLFRIFIRSTFIHDKENI